METLLNEISKLIEEKTKRIELLEWQLENANQRITELEKKLGE